MAKSITLKEWIAELGVEKAAATINVTQAAIRNWRCGFVLPHPFYLFQIRKLTKGRLSIDASYDHHYSKDNPRRIKSALEFK